MSSEEAGLDQTPRKQESVTPNQAKEINDRSTWVRHRARQG